MKPGISSYVGYLVALSITSLMLSACGGSSSSSDDDASPTVSRGVITGFGSVYVNGHRFTTGGAQITVDDQAASESDLRLGMLVTVIGQRSGSGYSADRIIYDNELKGPVASITPDPNDPTRKTLVVLGQSVLVSSLTVFDDDNGLNFNTLAVGDFLEISGFISDAQLVATHIEWQNNSEAEITGIIENLAANSFTINGFPVSYGPGTFLEDIAQLANGLLVEVEGQLDLAGTTLIANKIEAEDFGFPDDANEVEIEGLIANFNAADNTFTIAGVPIDASNAILFPASLVLADGLIVEAEGSLVNGVLIAYKVEQEGKEIKVAGYLSAIDTVGMSVTFSFAGGDIVAQINAQTELEDDINGGGLLLSDLSPGDYVEVEGFADGSGLFNAVELERDSPDEIEIEAPVDAFDAVARTVDLLGVQFDLSAAQFEDENDNNISATAFFNALTPGRFIEIEDDDANGVFEKAELEN